MQANPYLSFQGQCEAAFTFYEQCLGGQRGGIFRNAGSPPVDQVPAEWHDKVEATFDYAALEALIR